MRSNGCRRAPGFRAVNGLRGLCSKCLFFNGFRSCWCSMFGFVPFAVDRTQSDDGRTADRAQSASVVPELAWLDQFGAPPEQDDQIPAPVDNANAGEVDAQGNLYVAGSTSGEGDLIVSTPADTAQTDRFDGCFDVTGGV